MSAAQKEVLSVIKAWNKDYLKILPMQNEHGIAIKVTHTPMKNTWLFTDGFILEIIN